MAYTYHVLGVALAEDERRGVAIKVASRWDRFKEVAIPPPLRFSHHTLYSL